MMIMNAWDPIWMVSPSWSVAFQKDLFHGSPERLNDSVPIWPANQFWSLEAEASRWRNLSHVTSPWLGGCCCLPRVVAKWLLLSDSIHSSRILFFVSFASPRKDNADNVLTLFASLGTSIILPKSGIGYPSLGFFDGDQFRTSTSSSQKKRIPSITWGWAALKVKPYEKRSQSEYRHIKERNVDTEWRKWIRNWRILSRCSLYPKKRPKWDLHFVPCVGLQYWCGGWAMWHQRITSS